MMIPDQTKRGPGLNVTRHQDVKVCKPSAQNNPVVRRKFGFKSPGENPQAFKNNKLSIR